MPNSRRASIAFLRIVEDGDENVPLANGWLAPRHSEIDRRRVTGWKTGPAGIENEA
jgi:hypothetical protein